jgi:hypothetical protein
MTCSPSLLLPGLISKTSMMAKVFTAMEIFYQKPTDHRFDKYMKEHLLARCCPKSSDCCAGMAVVTKGRRIKDENHFDFSRLHDCHSGNHAMFIPWKHF